MSARRCETRVAGAQDLQSPPLQYRAGIVWVKFIGTHEQYDRINVESVNAY